MKFDRIPTRRKPVKKTFYARLFNKPKAKKQRASAAAAYPEDVEGSGINISRSLSIIFAIHIVAIGMIFIHKQYLSGRTEAPDKLDAGSAEVGAAEAPKEDNVLPVLSSGDKPYMVKKGDNYAIIASKFQVDESDLRNLNPGTDIRAGVILKIPQGNRIVAEQPKEIAELSKPRSRNDHDRGLVELLPPIESSEARLILPSEQNLEDVPRATPVFSGKTHTVKPGESVWRISNQYKVSQDELMAINKISDPTKLKIGQVLKLP